MNRGTSRGALKIVDEAGGATCAHCGQAFPRNAKGRPRRFCSPECKRRQATALRQKKRNAERRALQSMRDAQVTEPVPARSAARIADRLEAAATSLEATAHALDLPRSRALIATSLSERHRLNAYQLTRAIESTLARQKHKLMEAQKSSDGTLKAREVARAVQRCDEVFEMSRELGELAGVAPPASLDQLHYTAELDELANLVEDE